MDTQRHTATAIRLHWLIAALILDSLFIAITMHDLPRVPQQINPTLASLVVADAAGADTRPVIANDDVQPNLWT